MTQEKSIRDFWKIVNKLKWDGNYVRCARQLNSNYTKKEIVVFEKTVYSLMGRLEGEFADVKIHCGSDAWSDIRAETIGRGEKFFTEISAKKLIDMAIDIDYKESFLYILH